MTNDSVAGISTPPLLFSGEFYTSVKFLTSLWLAIISFGMLSNTTNFLVFLKSGLKDNVTILLFCLSISDISFLVLITPTVATSLIFVHAPTWPWPFDRRIVSFLLYWPAFTFYDFSAYLSVCLGVMRCACVAMPLHFKLVFTKSRTMAAVVIIFCSTILLRIPVLTVHSVGMKMNPLTNQSYAYLKKDSSEVKVFINDVLNRTSMPWVSFIIMVTCVIILTYKLFDASKVRLSHTSCPEPATNNPSDDQKTEGQQRREKHINQSMSSKEAQVVRSVVLVCVIFILSQLPFLLYSTARLIYPEFDEDTHFRFLFGFCSNISVTCSYLNASVNIFVYYKFNSHVTLGKDYN
ncbi:hypothetical protein EGW08_019368 [Elysia chlorotica]|uniref:G-protein coupled receptors family 1 profile domain-containing protein n=1 Tax=Elysia chlorotica TaxID=188477 RepID=A0A3S0ZE21_ELYCH|nr:hypothetical protein EGW08_019368 [Elysia chlorotica]